ncbi:MAG TPA: ABC transporter permease [Geminicoccus sp.]|jgi:ribose transport system permease protein|uniref:ABC transporter permease n=1 Tax=Geminicoccus sp. TaxID=2024832 RepID=UPI002E35CA26|nr:ABC transporter permease [Geminicoccus sp.]HEX2529654.1 ABC transporter permease [Geminicoccus sp.]
MSTLPLQPSSAEPEHDQAAPHRWATLVLQAGSLLAFAAVLIFFSATAPFFLSFFNFTNVIAQSAILAILAFGMTIVIIGGGANVVTGGIDLSVAANLGLSAAVYASLIQAGHGDSTAVAATLLTGLLIGGANAFAVVIVGILPLLATLAVMNVAAGLELVLTENTVVPASSSFLMAINDAGPLGIPNLAYIVIIVAIIVTAIVQYSALGLRLYAVGEHREAARAAGLPVQRYIVGTYLASGLFAAIAAILSVAYLSGSSTGSAELLLGVVVTSLLGVVFSRRLVPTITGSLLAALFIGFLSNGFQLLNISSYWVSGVQGALILVVVAVTSILRRKET